MKGKPCINQDMRLFVWQSANVIHVAGHKAVSLLWDRGRGGGLNKKPASWVPRMAVLLWHCDEAVFVFTVGSQTGEESVFMCHLEYLCCGGVALQTSWYRWGRLSVTMSNLKFVLFWRFHISNLSSCLPVCWLHNTIYVPRELFRLSNHISMNTAYDALWIIIYGPQIFDTKQI